MIIFRADGNKTIGVGHVMRCLSIADALKGIGVGSAFICADDNVEKLIKGRGFPVEILGTDYTKPDEETDVLLSCDSLKKAEGIVVDSYFVTESYFDILSEYVRSVYIDDYESNFKVDGLINYNVYADREAYERLYDPEKVRLFLGPQYAPLRKEFYDISPIQISEEVKNILILTGGADPFHIALRLAKEIAGREDCKAVYHFVVGAFSSDLSELKKLADGNRIIIHQDVKDMKALMLKCDLAVSAAGSTLYELCACGIPTVNYTFADNQIAGAKAFSDSGIMMTAGDVRTNEDFACEIMRSVDRLSNDMVERKRMSGSAHRLVDGCGAGRLAEGLEDLFRE